MPTPRIRTTMTLEGEKEYRAAISEINSALKVLGSEMKLTKERFSEQAGSMEALSAKHDVLERQYLTQKEKVDALRGAVDLAAKTYGEASTKTNSYKVSLNNAETELLKLDRALKSNQDALDQARAAAESAGDGYEAMDDQLSDAADGAEESGGIIGKLKGVFGDVENGGKSLGDTADDLTGKIGVQLPDGAKKALDAISPFSGKLSLIASAAAAAAAAIWKVEEALIGITSESAERATSISNIAETINMSVESTQLWDYVLKSVGSSIEEAQGDLSAFQEKIMEAAEGTGEAYEMFAKLGVAVQDENGALRETEPVLMDVIKALQLMADETERNAISSTLLGGTGEKLIPIYNDNAQSIELLMDRKRELGVLTGDEIESLKKVTQAMVDYEEKTTYAKDVLAKDFAPALVDFYEVAGDGLKTLAQAAEDSNLITFFGSILSLVSALSPAFDILGSVVELLQKPLSDLSIALSIVSDGLRIVLELISAIVNLFTLDISGFFNNLTNIGSVFTGSNSAFSNVFQNSNMINSITSPIKYPTLSSYNASGTDNFPGGYTWVGENGPERLWLPRGSRIDNAQESRMYGGDVFYITIHADKIKELNDLIRMANDARRMQRMGVDSNGK